MSEVRSCRWAQLRILAVKACGTHADSAAYGALRRAIDATEILDLTALATQRDEGLAREAELKRQLKETPIPQDIAAELERTDWTPKQALKWYAEGKHFDVVAGRTRIIDTGHVASNALKHLSAEYLEHKGDAQLHELQQRLAEAKRLLLDVRGQLCGPDQRAIDAFLASPGCADGENRIERGSEHGFEQSPNSCRHDEKIGVWWRERGVTRTGSECVACGHVDEDGCADGEQPS